jgi:hypothetical protein
MVSLGSTFGMSRLSYALGDLEPSLKGSAPVAHPDQRLAELALLRLAKN